MIKQTVSYGVWTINRHDDNKLEILKNGQLCEKNTPALREIAAELGYEIDPEWRTSQLGRNVLKAVENAANSSCTDCSRLFRPDVLTSRSSAFCKHICKSAYCSPRCGTNSCTFLPRCSVK